MCRPEISTNMGVQSVIKVPRDPLKHFRTCECACGVPACGFNRKSFHLPIRPSGCGRCRACRDVFDEKRKNRRGTVTKLWDRKNTYGRVPDCLVVRKQKKFWHLGTAYSGTNTNEPVFAVVWKFFLYFVLIHVRKSQEKFKRFIRRGFFTILISAQGPSTAFWPNWWKQKFLCSQRLPLQNALHCYENCIVRFRWTLQMPRVPKSAMSMGFQALLVILYVKTWLV